MTSLFSDARDYLLSSFTTATTTTTNDSDSGVGSPKPKPQGLPFSVPLDTLDNTSSTLTLPNGRTLSYAEYGSPTGIPILLQHGHPGSRIDGAFLDATAHKLGARIIAADRPGIGLSSPDANRKLLDVAAEMEVLAAHLRLDEYRVLGISGGGPSALACAMALPRSKLKSVSIVCGLGPPDIGMRGARLVNWLGFSGGYRVATEGMVRWFWRRDPLGQLELSDEMRVKMVMEGVDLAAVDERDKGVLGDEGFWRFVMGTTRECFRNGFAGVLMDGRLACEEFGFRVEDISPDLPVQLWYGERDVNVPLNHGRQIAERLGGRARLHVKDETHTSLQVNWQEEILRDLVNA